MNEETGEMVVIKKKQISDILTLNHEYLGNAIGISAQGIQSMRKEILVDSIHSLVVKNKNFGKALGFPFKVAGGGLGLLGGLLILASKDTKTDIRGNEETEYDPGQFIGGGLAVGVGISLFYLGNKMGDRKVEKEKTTYYLHKWSVKIVDRKNVGRYREAIEK